jgi:hypothetical protein
MKGVRRKGHRSEDGILYTIDSRLTVSLDGAPVDFLSVALPRTPELAGGRIGS